MPSHATAPSTATGQSKVDQKLAALNLQLPQPVTPVANYVPFVITGNLVFISGQLPMKDGKLQYIGKTGQEITIEDAAQAAKLCGINLLAQLKAACKGNLDRVKRCVRLGVFVASAPGFTDQPKVANGVSDLMVDVMRASMRAPPSASASCLLALAWKWTARSRLNDAFDKNPP